MSKVTKNEASGSCSDLQLGWALHKPRNQAVRFTDEVKQYLTTKFDLGGRTGNKADPGKVAADMRNRGDQMVRGCLKEKTG